MHSNYNRPYRGICSGSLEFSREPSHLIKAELIGCGVIESNEVNATINPVIVCFHHVIARIVRQPLLPNHRRVKPVRKLGDGFIMGFRLDQFMIADAKKDRRRSKGIELMLN